MKKQQQQDTQEINQVVQGAEVTKEELQDELNKVREHASNLERTVAVLQQAIVKMSLKL